MKRNKLSLILSQWLCLCTAFTACTDDEPISQSNSTPLQISVTANAPVVSRAIIDGGYLPDGAQIGVTLTTTDGAAYDNIEYTNLLYSATGEGDAQTWSSTSPASLSTTTGKVTAYYPYNDAEDLDLTAIPVETESQTDYMYATPVEGVSMVSSKVNLTMQHALTDVRINIKKGTYTGTGAVTKVTAQAPAFATSATMNMEDGALANVSGSDTKFAIELTDATISTEGYQHDFLVVPDASSTSGDAIIFVTIDGKKFTVTVPYTEAFQQGYTYAYNLTLDNAELTLTNVDVSKWSIKSQDEQDLEFYDNQYIVEIEVPSDNYTFTPNIFGYTGIVDWGDGSTSEYNSYTAYPDKHTYATAGTYIFKLKGTLNDLNSDRISISSGYLYPSKIITKLVKIGKEMGLRRLLAAFYGQTKLTEIVPGALDGCTEVFKANSNPYGCFENCTSLKSIPKGLFDSLINVTDFSRIFYGCTALTEIPEGLFDNCPNVTNFTSTFYGCTKLSTIPEGLFDNCPNVTSFAQTFYNCTKLTAIPSGLFDKCTEVTSFNETFWGCSRLSEIPSGLFDECTAVTGFKGTFFRCTGLAEIPSGLFDYCPNVTDFGGTFAKTNITKIPTGLFDYNSKVTTFSSYTEHYYYGCFSQCKLLESIPEGLFDNCTEVTSFGRANSSDYSGTFASCVKISEIPEGLFDYNTKVTDFGSMFFRCSGLQAIPVGLFDKCTEVTSFNYTFYGCTSLQTIPEGLFDSCSEVTDFGNTFYNCSGLTAIPEKLFDNCPNVTSFKSTFSAFGSTSKISTIPTGLFDNCPNVTSFYNTFYNCTAITEIPSGLFDNNSAVTDFGWTFYNTGITSIPEMLFDNCPNVTSFEGTFYNTSITAIPEGLFDECKNVTSFRSTFYSTPITYIPTKLFDKCTKVTNFYETFYGCSRLTGESPYSTITVTDDDGNSSEVKVRLYERSAYTGYFAAPTSYTDCFYNCTGLTDYTTMSTSYADWI